MITKHSADSVMRVLRRYVEAGQLGPLLEELAKVEANASYRQSIHLLQTLHNPSSKLPLRKIISGGQTGADRAGLRVGKALGLETGGWMPAGFKAQDGTWRKFEKMYGMKEHTSPDYPPRTAVNVATADGTVRFAGNWHSAGEVLTLRLINEHRKPYFDVDVNEPPPMGELVAWLLAHRIQVLNVAGNAEATWPGIGAFTERYLKKALKEVAGVKA